ncbi:MAG: hypothetical protein IPH75_02155 [bacterium]|nr:hypothetical protein [bacterium]
MRLFRGLLLVCSVILLFGLCVNLAAQEDLTKPAVPAVDSLMVVDSSDTIPTDSLTPAERAARSFEERMRKAREQAPKRTLKPRLSINDTLQAEFLPSRMDQRDWMTRSYFMNASDYFKSSPSYLVQRWQLTPARSTVQPYGLAGDRLGYVHDGVSQSPFEHSTEPDGSMDVEDLSTSLDNGIFILPSGAGMIFGADQAIATLVTTPLQPANGKTVSSFLLDKGNYGFSHTRGRYANQFSDGRLIRLGIGYRVAEGAQVASGNVRNTEDTYAYDGSGYFPVTELNGVTVSGHLYHRQGPMLIRPDQISSWVNRDRFDRNLRLYYSMSNDSQTVRTNIGYRHLRQGSYLNSAYNAKFNLTGHGLEVNREWYASGRISRFSASVDRVEYDNQTEKHPRHTSELSWLWAQLHRSSRLAARFGIKYAEEFRIMPYGGVLWIKESDRMLLVGSIGYAEKAPSLHELYLTYHESQLYGIDTTRYADKGNPGLSTERQLTGAIRMEVGTPENGLTVEAVGGTIYDGIEWDRTFISVTSAAAWYFTPVNTDISFATVSAQKRIRVGQFATFLGGCGYFWREFERYTERPYQPDYQVYGGLELHHYWQSKLMHFWAYGEIQYTGAYEGFDGELLGEQAVLNGKLSFSMGNFRFRIVYQNALDQYYSTREQFEIPGRVVTWGFDWNFFD